MPEPSWQPALIAFGLAAVLASIFTWWPYGVIGAVLALVALRRMDPRRAPQTSTACPASSGSRPR